MRAKGYGRTSRGECPTACQVPRCDSQLCGERRRRKLMYVCISRSWGIGSPASQHPILAIAMDIPISELARF
jgi:hypothetical protein